MEKYRKTLPRRLLVFYDRIRLKFIISKGTKLKNHHIGIHRQIIGFV